MATLENHKGLQVVSPTPTGDGGSAINNDFKLLVDWNPRSNWEATTNPTKDDDERVAENYRVGSRWFNASLGRLFLCTDSTEGAAIWHELTLTAVPEVVPLANWSPSLDEANAGSNSLADFQSGSLATINGGTWVDDTDAGGVRALEFDGATSWVDMGNSFNRGTGDFSLSVWFKADSTLATSGAVSYTHLTLPTKA